MAASSDIGAVRRLLPIPEAVGAEQGVLGAILMENAALAVVAQHVDVDDFGHEIHRRIYKVASALIAQGKPASPLTLRAYLGDDELAEGVTVPAYLARLAAEALPLRQTSGMAKHVREIAARRRLIAAAAVLDEKARDVAVEVSAAEIAGGAMIEMQTIAASSATDSSRPIIELADDLIDQVEKAFVGSDPTRTISTGYSALDEAMNGYEPGTLVVVAGRPGMGKTIFANSTAFRCAREGVGVLEWPLEVGVAQMWARHVADIAYCGPRNSPAFRDVGRRAAQLDHFQMDAVRNANALLRDLPIVMDARSRATLPQIAAKVAQVKRDMRSRGVELGLVVLDHLDFIVASDRYRGMRVQEIGEIVLGLKDIARSQDVCVLLLCQLNRDVERRAPDERRPVLNDLRNSGDLEQVADVVALLYREEYYLERSPEYRRGEPEAIAKWVDARGKLEVILAKVRAGPTPTVHLWCDAASSSISNHERGRG